MSNIARFISTFLTEYVETIEPPLDNSFYRYAFALLPASYFFATDILSMVNEFLSYMLLSPSKTNLRGDNFVNEGGLFTLQDLLPSLKRTKSAGTIEFEEKLISGAQKSLGLNSKH